MKSLAAFFRLPGRQRFMAVEAALWLLLARVLVWGVPMRYWRLHPVEGSDGSVAADRVALGRLVGGIVRGVARRVPAKVVCLPRAMAAQWMLRRRGVGGDLVLGARRTGPEQPLDYHAWLTVDGECVIGGRGAGAYTPFPSPTRHRAA